MMRGHLNSLAIPVVAIGLAAAAGPCVAADLAAALAKHEAWRGGDAYRSLSSIHVTGDFEAAGLKGVTEEWRDRRGYSRDDYELGPVKGVTVIGPHSWQIEAADVVEDVPEGSVADARNALALTFGDMLREPGIEAVGLETRDGKPWLVVRARRGSDTYDAFIDPGTGALWGYRITEDRRRRFERLADWRMVDGVRMPFLRETTSDIPTDRMVVRVRAMELNRAMPAQLLDRPQGKRLAVFAEGGSGVGPLPFRFLNGNRIYIPAKVQGQAVEVLLDSGADTTVLDRAFAKKIGLKLEGEVTAVGTGGATAASLARGVTIQIDGMTLPDMTVAVLDMSDVSKRLGIPLDVVLGEEVFKQLVVDIDFEQRRIGFHDPAAFKPPAGAVVLPVKEADGVRTVPVSIEGGPEVQVDFDIGNGGSLVVSPAYYAPRRLLDGRRTSTRLGGAVGGAREEKVATLKSVRFAGVEFHDVPATFPAEGPTALNGERSQGNIGQAFYARFRMATDYTHDRVYLAPHADAATRPFQKDRSGLGVVQDGARLTVNHVAPGSPAQAGGWKVGDTITAIDGRPIGADYVGSDLSHWRYGKAGREVRLDRGDRRRTVLRLADYY